MTPRSLSLESLTSHVGEEVGISDWLEVTQERISRFADATDDWQWIHIDPSRAAAESPYRTTIAHGFLTLSLVSVLLRQAIAIDGVRLAINYGVNRVRFVSAVPAGSKIRGRFTLAAADARGASIQATWAATIERERKQKPACVIDWLVRYYARTAGEPAS
jgi:acyl dehydratase